MTTIFTVVATTNRDKFLTVMTFAEEERAQLHASDLRKIPNVEAQVIATDLIE